MNRREFAKIAASMTAGALPMQLGCSPRAQVASGETLDRIGLQLYTVRNMMRDSVRDTLVEVARIGYTEVEFAGYFGQSASDIRVLLDGLGVNAPGAHVSITELQNDLDGLIEFAQTVGHDYLIVPSIDQSERTPEGYRRIADEFNVVGERLRDADLMLGYHNHDFDFDVIDGQIGYDILLERCQDDLVIMEMDFFWIAAAGRDPLEYFAKYPGRFRLCHVKDRDPNGNMVDVGDGTLDFAALITAGRHAGLEHFLVEHDGPRDALASVTASFDYLSQLNI